MTQSNAQRATDPNTAYDAVVVGGGQAGLAIAYHLSRRGLHFEVLDAGASTGHSWRRRWDSLRLFTPAEYCSLPGMPFPAAAGTYPAKDEVADYLDRYASAFQLPVLHNVRVRKLTHDGTVFHLDTNQGTRTARQVVVATGACQQPRIPELARQFSAGVAQLHSADYVRPTDIPPGRVLVEGAGNSGLQIAAELAATHDVHVAVGGKQTMVPQRLLGRDLFWWLTTTGLLSRPASSPLARLLRRKGGDLVIGTSTTSLLAAGVALHGRLIGAQGRSARLADGDSLEVDAVVWATGFRSEYPWIDIDGVWDGRQVVHQRGRTPTPGLWFLGLPWQHTRGSALLGFVKEDAEWIASQLADSLDRAAVEDCGRDDSWWSQPVAMPEDSAGILP